MAAVIALMATLAAQSAQSTTAPTSSLPSTEPSEARTLGQSTYLDLEGGAGYSTNPELSFGSNTGGAHGYVSVHAVHTRITDRVTTLLSAFAQESAYTRHHGSNQSLSVTARHDAAVNEKLSIFADGSASYNENGLLDTTIINVPNIPALPGTPNIPPQILPPGSDFLAFRGKQYFFSADAGGQLVLSMRDSLNFSGGLAHTVFRSSVQDTSYWSIPASIGYNRQLSPRLGVGGRLAFDYTNYNGPGRIWTVDPQLTTNVQLSERMSLNAAVGASFSSFDDGITTRHSTGLAANVTLCNLGENSRLCARAAFDQTAATVVGPAKRITAGIDYSRQLDADSSVQLSVDGSHYSSPFLLVSGQSVLTSTYYRAVGSYTRKFGRRLSGGVNLAARKLVESGPDPKADLNGSLFIRYRFGSVQ